MRRSASFIIMVSCLATTARAEDLLPPQIVHEPCEELKRGEPFEIWARFYDDSPIFDPKVIYRIGDSGAWKNAPFTKEPQSDDFKAVIAKRELRGPLEYFIEAFDENGNGPARYGTPEAPIRVLPSNSPRACQQIQELAAPVGVIESSQRPEPGDTPSLLVGAGPPPPAGRCEQNERPFWCEPLFWGAVGAVAVVGGGVGTYFLFFDDDSPPAPASQEVRLRIGAPDPTEAALVRRRP